MTLHMGAKLLSLVAGGVLVAASCLAADTPANSNGKPTTQPAEHLIVEGQVFDYVGSGVNGVAVRVFTPSHGGRKKIASTTTDEMGDFKVRHAESVRGKLIVTFAKPGFKPHEIEVESVPDNEFPPFIDHELHGAMELKGVVRDDLKNVPVSEAKVTISVAYNDWSATTDESGKFKVENLSPCRARVIIEADGFARFTERLELVAPEETRLAASQPALAVVEDRNLASEGELVYRLKPERIVRLAITDAEGQPIPKVVVESFVKETNDFRTGVTDDTGRLTLDGLSIDAVKIVLRLTHPEHVSSTSFDRAIDLPHGETESSHTLTMSAAATVTGKITTADGRPLGGARLIVGQSMDEIVATAWSDFEGAFTLLGVPVGESVITVHLAEYAPRLLVVQADTKTPTMLEVVLGPAVEVAGRVLGLDGKPVRGAHVVTVGWKGHNTLALQAVTDSEGQFTIRDAPVEEFAVTVRAHGFKPLENQTVRGGQADLCFRFTEEQTQAQPGLARFKPGDQSPAFEATTLDGKKIKLADFRGKYVFLDFWATWCVPCVVETPNLVALHEALGRREDFEIISVSLDTDENNLRAFIKDHKLVWTHVFGEQAGAKRLVGQFGAGAIPTSYLIGPDGKIMAGNLGGKRLVEDVRKLMDQSKSAGDVSSPVMPKVDSPDYPYHPKVGERGED